ncbi:MAG: hypothetical protein AB8H86_21025 [Polyangiales bacterium]
MSFPRLFVLVAAFGLSLSASTSEAQVELTPPLTATSHVFSLTNLQLQLQENNAQVGVQVSEVPVTYVPAAQPLDVPSRRYHLWSILWGGGIVMTGLGGLVWLVEQFDGGFFGASMMGLGGLMIIGGIIGHVVGGARYRRRMREYQRGVVYLDGTTLRW